MLPKRSVTRATPVGAASPTNFKPRPGLSNTHVAKSSLSCSSTKKRARPSIVETGGLLPRSFKKRCYSVVEARSHYYVVEDGETTRKIWDISGGAAVSNLGPGSTQRIKNAARAQEDRVSYVPGLSFDTPIAKEYAQELLKTTDGMMKGVIFYGSGSEAVEATHKLVLQRFQVIGQPQRRLFIAREQSYHGTTLAAISIGGHRSRRQPFANVLTEAHHVSPCNPYRDMQNGETEREYVARLESQLRAKFEELGPENVAAFIVEPVVGAALGCMPSSPGYLQAMKKVCRDYGALFIVDEIMCGYGRCGTMHAWQRENVVPDIEVMGKGLAGGYKQISAMLISNDLYDELEDCEFTFNHGHTFQNSPEGCAAGLECLKIIQEQDLVKNVEAMGTLLKQGLETRLGPHPNVLNIRGRGLFIGIEFGSDKNLKRSFKASEGVGQKIHELGLMAPHNIHVYPGFGCNGGTEGDHIIVSPPFTIDEKDVAAIVEKVGKLVEDYFSSRS